MNRKLVISRTILRSDAESAKTSLWEIMDYHEVFCKAALEQQMREDGLKFTKDIFYDWSRKKEPERYELRAWCIADCNNDTNKGRTCAA